MSYYSALDYHDASEIDKSITQSVKSSFDLIMVSLFKNL